MVVLLGIWDSTLEELKNYARKLRLRLAKFHLHNSIGA